MGRVDITVTADAPTYAIFDKNGAKTYVAFNPGDGTIIVNFSDGERLLVPARSLRTSPPQEIPVIYLPIIFREESN